MHLKMSVSKILIAVYGTSKLPKFSRTDFKHMLHLVLVWNVHVKSIWTHSGWGGADGHSAEVLDDNGRLALSKWCNQFLDHTFAVSAIRTVIEILDKRLKFRFSKKATKFELIFQLDLMYFEEVKWNLKKEIDVTKQCQVKRDSCQFFLQMLFRVPFCPFESIYVILCLKQDD